MEQMVTLLKLKFYKIYFNIYPLMKKLILTIFWDDNSSVIAGKF